MSELKALIEHRPYHWTDEAVCDGDERFTARYESLSDKDTWDMLKMCCDCPVLMRCAKWADDEAATDVWAAGYWRFPNGDGLS